MNHIATAHHVASGPYRILCVVGARPNFMKMAPVLAALAAAAHAFSARLLHTGQHYDVAMNQQIFQALGMPAPDIYLNVGSGTHAQQTAEVMRRFEPALQSESPDAVLVVGDVNSTLACALVANKLGVPVFHVEAGLRSGDRTMPEEINRILTDQLADLLFTTEPSARENLLREGIEVSRIHDVGNVMIDALLNNLPRAVPASATVQAAGRPGFADGKAGYALLTLHRPSNVDQPEVLRCLLETALTISRSTPLIFPIHPRTGAMIAHAGLSQLLDDSGILSLPPMGYLEMLGLMRDARVVLTDSGGVQEETTALGVPCITLRDNTERPITVEQGTNVLAGRDAQRILAAYGAVLSSHGKRARRPLHWDGQAAGRIVQIMQRWLHQVAGPGR